MNFFTSRAFYKFLVPSALGAFLFVTPIQSDGNFTVPIALAANLLLDYMGEYSALIIYFLISASGIITLVNKLCKPPIIQSNSFLRGLFGISGFWFWVRITGLIFIQLIFFNLGPNIITGGLTGGLIIGSLMPILVCMFLLAGLLLPLLLNFGLLDFFGALLEKVMRPVFNLPGRSAIDCVASWLGDGSIGVLLTSRQYQEGHYSRREASVIATTFSAVSITFSLVVISEVGLQHMFFQFYITVIVAGIVAALIVPRLSPLSKIPDSYMVENALSSIKPSVGKSPLEQGLTSAIEKAVIAPSFKNFIKDGVQNVFEMWMGVLPVILAVGTVVLVFVHYTPIFKILGLPFVPIYRALGIPEAYSAAQTVMVGFADMFLPSVIASGIESEMTRFVVASTSVTQLIYMSEVGSIIIGSKLSISLKYLFIIFLERTLVTLPVIALIAHFIF